jgi:hypothetical protein
MMTLLSDTVRYFVYGLALIGGLTMGLAVQPAGAADTCADKPFIAQGEPSTFEWLAKTKARANWRSRVRATRDLGTAYANWSMAANRDERCAPTATGFVCSFTGTPCKP